MKVKSEDRKKKAIKNGCLVWWDGTSNPKPLTPYFQFINRVTAKAAAIAAARVAARVVGGGKVICLLANETLSKSEFLKDWVRKRFPAY